MNTSLESLQIALNRIPSDETPYLGDTADIGIILQAEAAMLADNYQAVLNGTLSREDAIKQALVRCQVLAGIFLGKDPEHYAPMGPWNTDGQVADYVRERIFKPTDASAGSILESAFAVMFSNINDELVKAGNGELAPSDAADNINANLDDWARMLVGMLPTEAVLESPE